MLPAPPPTKFRSFQAFADEADTQHKTAKDKGCAVFGLRSLILLYRELREESCGEYRTISDDKVVRKWERALPAFYMHDYKRKRKLRREIRILKYSVNKGNAQAYEKRFA